RPQVLGSIEATTSLTQGDTDNGFSIHQHIGQQVAGHLRARGHENFIAPGHDASRWQQAVLNLIHQGLRVAINMVLSPFLDGRYKQGLVGAGAPVFEWHQAGIKLTIHKRVGVILPVGRFDDVALIDEVRFKPLGPLQAGGHGF
ncbi:hypothetical protein, partial [Limnohabitans sp.]